jgi:hypothetical protein
MKPSELLREAEAAGAKVSLDRDGRLRYFGPLKFKKEVLAEACCIAAVLRERAASRKWAESGYDPRWWRPAADSFGIPVSEKVDLFELFNVPESTGVAADSTVPIFQPGDVVRCAHYTSPQFAQLKVHSIRGKDLLVCASTGECTDSERRFWVAGGDCRKVSEQQGKHPVPATKRHGPRSAARPSTSTHTFRTGEYNECTTTK